MGEQLKLVISFYKKYIRGKGRGKQGNVIKDVPSIYNYILLDLLVLTLVN